MSRVWVDDEREPPMDWVWMKTNAGAIDYLRRHRVEQLSLDYVLKNGETTDTIMEWLRDHPERWPTGDIQCHSGSGSAQLLIEQMVREYDPRKPDAPTPG